MAIRTANHTKFSTVIDSRLGGDDASVCRELLVRGRASFFCCGSEKFALKIPHRKEKT